MSKGSKRRKMEVSREEFEKNWDSIFNPKPACYHDWECVAAGYKYALYKCKVCGLEEQR